MAAELTLGSLFDGIGGFCYAATLTGRIKPIWAAEIEQSCIDITRFRFPEVMHVGSVTELKGDEIQPVDIITFGSPCQDLSIAGQRKGLKGNRSGLFMEAIRIIDEMRLATNGKYPTFIIWENVPGAFSSRDGADFRAVLEAITKTDIPMPASGKWGNAGMVRGAAVDTAWRILDAQYWGVPQRRKRIYLVGDFGGQRAGEILFKSESLLGYTPKSKGERAETAGQPTDSIRTESSRGGEVLGLDFAHADSVVRTFEDKTPTLLQNMGSAGGQVPCILKEEKAAGFIYNQGGNGKGLGYEEEKAPTIMTGGTTTVFIEKKNVTPLRNEVTRMKNSNGLGVGEVGGPCPTLTVQDVHSVFYEAYQHHGYRESGTSGTLTAGQNNTIRGDTPLVVKTDKKAFEENQHGGYRETEINGTLRAAGGVIRRRVGNSDNREYQDKGEYP
jgi:DNA (cytosine-5)-methyltransferase 1